MTTQNQPLRDDEFDVEVFSSKLYRVFKKALNKLFYPFRVLFANPLRLLVFLLTAVAIAFVFKLSMPAVYTSSFVLRPNNSGDLTFANLLHDLENITENRDYAVLEAELGIQPEMAENIKKIEGNIIWRSRLKDTAKLIEIILHVKDPAIFKDLQDAIIFYLENNEHYALFRRLRQQDIDGMKTKVTADLAEIDSLKQMLASSFNPKSAGGFVYGEAPDAVKVYESSLNLYRQKLSLNWQEAYVSNFELMKACVISTHPSKPDIWKLLAIFIVLGLVACFLYNLFMDREENRNDYTAGTTQL